MKNRLSKFEKIFNGLLISICVVSVVVWVSYYFLYAVGFYKTDTVLAGKEIPTVQATTSPLAGAYDSSGVMPSPTGNILQLIKHIRSRSISECSTDGQTECAATAVRPAGENQGTKTLIPTTSDIDIDAGYYDGITVSGDADLIPGAIKAGVDIFGVTGTAPDPIKPDCVTDGEVDCSVRVPLAAGQLRDTYLAPDGQRIVDIPTGYYDGTKEITIQDTDLVAANIRAGVTIMGVTGTWEPLDCEGTPWGTIAHGDNVTAYSTSSPCHQTCGEVSETRTCYDGSLSGAWPETNCLQTCQTCDLPWGGTINHGQSVTAYEASIGPVGGCASENRVCDNGILSGDFINHECNTYQSSCDLPWGGTISHGQSVTAYSDANPEATCASVSETRVCNSGYLSGTFENEDCLNGCLGTPWGDVASGFSDTAYSTATPTGTCASVSSVRTCTDGTLDGAGTIIACDEGCSLDGVDWASGTSHTFYNNATPTSTCASVSGSRSCTDGTIGGTESYSNATCAEPCTLDSVTWASGTNSTFYNNATPTSACAAASESRACTDGTIGGTASYNLASCAGGCTLDGVNWASGTDHTFYSETTPTDTCVSVSESRSCTDSVIGGTESYSNASCAEPCTLDGMTWASGTNHTFYSNTTPTGTCSAVSQSRSCTDGFIGGTASYQYASCANGCKTTDNYWTRSGSSRTMYSTRTPSGLCSSYSQSRNCTNGTWDGSSSYQYGVCYNWCTGTPWGSVIHGWSVTVYSLSAICGNTCSSISSSRSCNNGSFTSTGGTITSCSESCTPGQLMPDGSYYAGLSPDGNVKMYVTSSAYINSSVSWGTYDLYTSAISEVTGESNTTALATNYSYFTDIYGATGSPAAEYCYNLTAHGKTDWYLPASEEIELLWNGGDQVGGLSDSWYWSSTQVSPYTARNFNLSSGSSGITTKSVKKAVCVRKD